jgi:hypothetical protein
MKSCPAFILERTHQLKLASAEAQKRMAEADRAWATLAKELDETQRHLDRTGTSAGESRALVAQRVEERRKELTALVIELTPKVEAAKEHAKRAADFNAVAAIAYQRSSDWLDSGAYAAGACEQVDVPVKGDHLVALQKLHGELAFIADEEARIKEAPTSRVDIETAVRKRLADMRGDVTVTIDEFGKPEIMLPGMQRQSRTVGVPFKPITHDALLRLALWLDPDSTEQKVMEVVDRLPSPAGAMPADTKKARLHELRTKREAILFECGAVVRAAIDEGILVPIAQALEPTHLLGVKQRTALRAVA